MVFSRGVSFCFRLEAKCTLSPKKAQTKKHLHSMSDTLEQLHSWAAAWLAPEPGDEAADKDSGSWSYGNSPRQLGVVLAVLLASFCRRASPLG
jgi:hypothetical protein